MDTYRIGVTIALANDASPVLGVVHRDVLSLHKSVDKLSGSLSAAKLAAAGLIGIAARTTALTTLGALADHGEAFVRQQHRMQEVGLRNQQVAEATAAAWKASSDIMVKGFASDPAPGRDLVDLIQRNSLLRQRAVTEASESPRESAGGAGEVAAYWHKLGVAAAAAIHGHGTTVATQVPKSLPTISSTADLTLEKAALLELFQIPEIMKARADGLDCPADVNAFELARQTTSDSLDPRAIEWLTHRRPTNPSRTAITNDDAAVPSQIGPNAPRDEELLKKPLMDRIRNVLGAAVEKSSPIMPDFDAAKIFRNIFPTMGSRLHTEGLRDGALVKNEVERLPTTASVDQYPESRENSTTRMGAFHSAWNNLVVALGAPSVDTASGLMTKLTNVMNDFLRCVAAHATELTTSGLTGLAVRTSAFPIGGATPNALATLAGPAASLVGVSTSMSAFATALTSLEGNLDSINKWLSAHLLNWPLIPRLPPSKFAAPVPNDVSPGISWSDAWSNSSAHHGAAAAAVPPSLQSLDFGGPMPVYVVNGRDLANGTSAQQAMHLSLPPNGPTNGDVRMTLPMSSFGIPVTGL